MGKEKEPVSLDFETDFVPPIGSESALSPHPVRGDRLAVATTVIEDEREAMKLVLGIKDYEYMLMAYIGEKAIGIQLMDYDMHEHKVFTGRQAISPSLKKRERKILESALISAAKMRYEDLF